MKKYSIKLLLFIGVILFLTVLFNSYQRNYYWGNEIYEEKIKKFEENKNEYNTVFFGSSTMECHIDPLIFDSLVSPHVNVSSFNLASRGSENPEPYFLYENFLASEASQNIKFAFIDLSSLKIREENVLFSDRVTYWLGVKELTYLIKSISLEEYSIKTKFYRTGSFVIAYLYKLIGLKGIKSNIYNEKKNDWASFWPYVSINSIDFNGYIPLHNDATYRTAIDPTNIKLKKEYELKLEGAAENQLSFLNDISNLPCNKRHLERVKELIEKSEKRGIKLYLIIPTTLYPNKEIYGMMNRLSKHVLDVSNINRFPEVYNFDNSFDLVHLNDRGARLNTKNIAFLFLKNIDIKGSEKVLEDSFF